MNALGSLTRSWRSVTSSDSVVKPKSAKDTVFDMVRSLGLVAVVVAVSLIFVPGPLHPSKSQKIQAIDYANVVIGFHQVTGTAALVPISLSTDWKATSESLTHTGSVAHLHIGFAAPQSTYAGLEEGNADPATFVRSVLGARGLARSGTTVINGAAWSTRVSQRGETSLVRTRHGLTVIITGSAGLTDDQDLAAALRSRTH